MNHLKKLELELQEELTLLNYPLAPWLANSNQDVYDVVIVGGGMAGLTAAFGLMRQGISHFTVLDAAEPGYEGPWETYARMRILRSGKDLLGPAMDIPKLTFRAWFTAQFGSDRWDALYKIPTSQWMDYLRWYRKVLHIPVQNGPKVTQISPQGDLIHLAVQNGASCLAQKVIIATGREGFGGIRMPSFVNVLPKHAYAHTCAKIDFTKLKGKRVGIIGAGASSLDAAATALENEAEYVAILMRRKSLPNVNKFASATYPGFSNGYYFLSDAQKIQLMQYVRGLGTPPPFESLDRVNTHSNFELLSSIDVDTISYTNQIEIRTKTGDLHHFDFLILATGFEINADKQPELATIRKDILFWKDQHPNVIERIGFYPYLGRHFQFLPKHGNAHYLQNIYCFNNAALMSHGLLSSDIPDISTGAMRLTKGIAADFFSQHGEDYIKRLEEYSKEEFLDESYPFIQ